MADQVTVDASESTALETVLRSIHARSGHAVAPTLSGLLKQWATFVQEVEAGYELSVYEYTNDLSVRDLLDEVIAAVPERLAGVITTEVQQWDDRFRIATRKVERPVAPGVAAGEPSRWFRVPRRLSGELDADLRSEGVLD